MSMNAMFVQVEEAEIARLERDPDLVEGLFVEHAMPSAGLLSSAIRERLAAIDPQRMREALSRLPDALRQQIEGAMARTTGAMGTSQGEAMLKLLQDRMARRAESAGRREVLSLDKAWHGVHYLLTGEPDPGPELLSQAVLGGVELGDDPEGFSGYGPARYFRAAEVRELSQGPRRAEVESKAAGRFDPVRMSQLQIYPGWGEDAQDKEWLMDAFRRLRDFYSNAAKQGRAVVTCLV